MAQKLAQANSNVLETQVPGREGEVDIRLRLNAPGQRGILQSLLEVKKTAARLLPKYRDMQVSNTMVLKKKKSNSAHVRALNKALRKAQRYVNKLQLLPEDASNQAKRAALIRGISVAIETGITANQEKDPEETEGLTKELKTAIRKTEELSRDFQHDSKRFDTVAESWLDVKWTTDNSTAVGRGPPGHVAFSPLTQYRLPYDVTEVMRVIEEANKRVR